MILAKKVHSTCQKTIEISFFLLFFLTPLIFTTINYELFEFNKMVLAYLLTGIILPAWIGKMILEKKIIFNKTFLFWPLVIFLTSQIASTITSINPHTSFFGYYTRQNGGLLSLATYALLYFAFTSNIGPSGSRQYLKVSLLSLTIVSVYGILQEFGIDDRFWTQDVRARVFSTLGQPNWLAAWTDGLIFLSLAFCLRFPKKKKSILFWLVFSIAFTSLLLTRSRSGFLAFWLVFPLLPLAVSPKENPGSKKKLLLFSITGILLTVLLLSPFDQFNQYFSRLSLIDPQSLPQWSNQDQGYEPDLGSATADIRKVVWQGAINIFKNYPLLGTGPETFAYSYYWYQPQAHNLLSEWDFLYNKAHNEYLNFLATTGAIGLTTYLILIGATLFHLHQEARKKTKNQPFIWALLAGYLTILITNFFGFSVVATNLLLFLIPALAYCLNSKKPIPSTISPKIANQQKITLAITWLVALNLIFLITKYWLADYYFTQGENKTQEGNYQEAYSAYHQAHRLRPKEPFYTNEMALNCAYLAVILTGNQNQEESISFINEAESWASETVRLNPYQINFYRQQSQTYYLLSQINSQYLNQSYQFLLSAHELAPINPKITYNLGVLSYQVEDLDQAINWLETTVILKADYQSAYYWLAKFYQENSQPQKARETLMYLLKNLDPNNQEAQLLLDQLPTAK